MGNKIITEKDFWQCSGGMMPSTFQARQLKVKRKDGAKYITRNDVSTVSWVDFGCKKIMLLYAVVAAVAAVVAALCVATGGAALVVIGALAGASGAAYGAIIGSLICGQLVAPTRVWLSYKKDFQIQGVETITGGSKITCTAFTFLGMSEEHITFNPEIKNWWQAIKMGTASFVANVLQGAMTGMMIGGAVVALPAMLEGGAVAFAEGGMLNAFRFLGSNVLKNYAATWLTGTGIALRTTMKAQSEMDGYGQRGYVTVQDKAQGFFGMELGTANSFKNIVNGTANPLDFVGIALWASPVIDMTKGEEPGKDYSRNENTESEDAPNEDENKSNDEQENPIKPASNGEVNEIPDGAGEFDAFEGDALLDGNNVPEGVMKGNRPVQPEYPVIDENGNITKYGKWYYERPSGFRNGVRDETWNDAKDENGIVRDPLTEDVMDPDNPWDMGHKPGYEFRKHQLSAAERGISRKQFLDEHNTMEHYRPELPSSNRSHADEIMDDTYFGD
ncbi:HNH/ENDO VII family nuclease [Chitinophagaceae bacterium 26-R-25]|nr:HNH/ENDO VII family nuclease [Chitinophagaceae bacterium 26-R-25]